MSTPESPRSGAELCGFVAVGKSSEQRQLCLRECVSSLLEKAMTADEVIAAGTNVETRYDVSFHGELGTAQEVAVRCGTDGCFADQTFLRNTDTGATYIHYMSVFYLGSDCRVARGQAETSQRLS